MKKAAFMFRILTIAALFLRGCGHPPDTDVTSSPEYGFTSFAGTTWRTKVKVAVADLKGDAYILAPEHYDSTHPSYRPPPDLHTFAVLPIGTRLRIERLMKDNGNGGFVRVIATLEDGKYSKTVYLDNRMLTKNDFLWPGESQPKIWGVAPDMLESDALPGK